MKKKIHKLKGTGKNHYRLMGISSHENDYRLSWAINSNLGFNFRKADNLVLYSNDKTESLEFSVFQFIDNERALRMNLISNRCPDGFLIKEMRNIDFFLQVFGDATTSFITSISQNLKSIDLVLAVFEIPPKNQRYFSNLPPE